MFKYTVFTCSLFLTACSVDSTYTTPDILSDIQVQKTLDIKQNKNKIENDWYKTFKDENLNNLIAEAIKNNLSIKQGISRLKQARYNLLINSKNSYPFLDGTGSYNFNKTNSVDNALLDSNTFKLGFDVSWELDIWGKNGYTTEHYKTLIKKAKFSLSDIHVSIISEVIQNYVDLRKNQEILKISQSNLRLQREILQTVKNKHRAGIDDDLSLNQAQYVVDTTNATIPIIVFQIENNKNAIATLLGCSSQDLSKSLDNYKRNFVSKPFKYSVKNLYLIPIDSIRTRPDILEAEEAIQAQNALVNVAIANLYPSLSLEATFGYISSSGRSLFNSDNQSYGYIPSITTPIWHWKQLKNTVELQRYAREEYLLNYNEALLTALWELKSTIINVEETYKANSFKKMALQRMQRIMELSKNKYENGLISFTDVANAEQNLLKAQQEYVESNANILKNLTAFYKATGGGYNFRNN